MIIPHVYEIELVSSLAEFPRKLPVPFGGRPFPKGDTTRRIVVKPHNQPYRVTGLYVLPNDHPQQLVTFLGVEGEENQLAVPAHPKMLADLREYAIRVDVGQRFVLDLDGPMDAGALIIQRQP